MGNWKNWLLPVLTALTVGALALLPLRLSTLEDGRLTGTVHTEPLAADNNFPSRPPELPGRLWLLAQYHSFPDLLTIVSQEPEREKLEELSAQAREELERLAEEGILPEKAGAYGGNFTGGLLYLRDQRDLSSAAFSYLNAYDKQTGAYLSLYLDGESGRILELEMNSDLLRDASAPAADIGQAFLDGLGLDYALMNHDSEDIAVFQAADSKTVHWVHRYKNTLRISLEVDWRVLDDDTRIAMGYPPASGAGTDASPIQTW